MGNLFFFHWQHKEATVTTKINQFFKCSKPSSLFLLFLTTRGVPSGYKFANKLLKTLYKNPK
jgi:hypothetical protein